MVEFVARAVGEALEVPVVIETGLEELDDAGDNVVSGVHRKNGQAWL
jgi:hypothetical protein